MTIASDMLPYRERLIPGPGLFTALLLVVPGVSLVMLPIASELAVPVAVVIYALLVGTFLLLSPSLRVEGGRLTAGRASIPVDQLGSVELLGVEALRLAIGPGNDARNFLLVRGWIHRGVRIENIDPADPAPYWVLTTRHPEKLARSIEAARSNAG
ncbi:DUF3093 domain-containing protein [Leucobacter insecticola]|uniref:DUF3093 domain-containing protein n=1 Tax=Leucobacter insecticola TaxID=2714934 RepID=A0A6G8FJL5_9MICO|nr:DUF3093 domain-containing protein [Leucobacter insecticola]QIM16567.1 DUF3093 domain-containing protein [Leucobacter insecticola]